MKLDFKFDFQVYLSICIWIGRYIAKEYFVGETCDIHYKKKSDGLIGADVIKSKGIASTAMRNMCNPPAIG